MKIITKELTDSLTPMEKEFAEWCYRAYWKWLEKNSDNSGKDGSSATTTCLVFITACRFLPGELDAFRSLHEKGIIRDIIPYEEMDEEDARKCRGLGNDIHKIVVDDTIAAVHNILSGSSITKDD